MVDTIWSSTRRQLRAELSEKDFAAWIVPLRGTWSAGVLTLEAPSGFFRDWVRRHHLELIERAVAVTCGGPAAVRLVVNRALAAAPEAPPAARPVPASGVATTRYTFESFVVGGSNQVAFNAARAVVEQPGARFNPLFVYGGVGLGKTHLLQAVAQGLRERGRAGQVVSLSGEDFVNEMIAALRREAMERFRQRFRRVGTLIVDDVHFLADKRRSQEEFVHTFNALYDGRKQIVLASDRAPHEMPGLAETLRSRLACGLLADIEPPDPALRVALVERKAAACSLHLSDDIVGYLAADWCANGRELEGALTKIDVLRGLIPGPLTLAAVRKALVPYVRPSAQRVSVGRVVAEVCQQYRVTRAEIGSARRTSRLLVPRQVAMYLCRRHTEASLKAIGAELGGRDHSTVMHALKLIERRLRDDPRLREIVNAVEARLAG
jgi:chromosomal replication initiator protein